jgi:hypothetical protein
MYRLHCFALKNLPRGRLAKPNLASFGRVKWKNAQYAFRAYDHYSVSLIRACEYTMLFAALIIKEK